MNKQWVLKVLSGAHVGAEVTLSAEEMTLGKGDDCDLVLDDVSLAEKHLSLRQEDEEKVVLKLLDTTRPINVGENKLEEGETEVQPFTLITIGTLFIAVGPMDEEWPVIDLQSQQKLMAPEPETGETGEEDSEEGTEETDTSGQPQEHTEEEESKAAPKPAVGPWLKFALLMIGVAFAALLLWLVLTDQNVEYLSKEQAEQLQEAATSMGAKITLQQDEAADQAPRINGFVSTEQQLQTLQTLIHGFDINDVEINIIASDKIKQAISSSLVQTINGEPGNEVYVVEVESMPGSFVLKGYVNDIEQWQGILTDLKIQYQMASSIKDEVEGLDTRIKVMQTMLEAAGLNKLVLRKSGVLLAVTGPIREKDQGQVDEIVEKFNIRYKEHPKAITPWDKDYEKTLPLTLNIKYITLSSSDPHLVLQDETRLHPGDSVGKGYLLDTITQKYLVLRKNREKVYYYLTPDTLNQKPEMKNR
ncbi:MAG: type III secretion system inner membrane ring subunit SctD [Gammaproteobacteria bacterium]